ncbi:MAG: DUF465 domain-containing protein [Alphaproteobacteria bacterium]|nr:DUF465 domain-containing protein [Alphaproteobacteria bacterium]
MTVEHHALVNDLPEYKDAIHALKVSNTHFEKLMEAYHVLTKEIEKIENGGGATSDDIEKDLKQRRVHIKDQLMGMLQETKCGEGDKCCGKCKEGH